MASNKKIYWSDTNTYITGNASSITVESDDTLQMNADTSATITSPLTSISGNLDVGSGLDVTGTITCSVDLNIEGDIDMATGKKLTWVDDNQYISGTATGITIETDDTFVVNSDTSTTFNTPSFLLSDAAPNFQIKSTNASNGVPLLTMIGDNANNPGDAWQIKTNTGVMTFSSDHNNVGTYNKTILSLTGHNTVTSSTVAVSGKLTVATDLDIEGDIDMATGKKVTWVDDNQYISGTESGITVESDDTFVVNSDTSVTLNTPLVNFLSPSTSHAELVIKSAYSSNGVSKITMISDNSNDVGDGWQLQANGRYFYLMSDIDEIGTYNKHF